jgi:hypothetical protein
MIEPEVAFANLADDMALAEAFLKEVIASVMASCAEDLAFFEKEYSAGLVERLNNIVSTPFVKSDRGAAGADALGCRTRRRLRSSRRRRASSNTPPGGATTCSRSTSGT